MADILRETSRPSGASRPGRGLATGGGAIVLLAIIGPLFREFYVPGETIWNVVLGLMLAAVAVGALLLQLWLMSHGGETGEARFDTRNKDAADG
jgi:hypothetical protein